MGDPVCRRAAFLKVKDSWSSSPFPSSDLIAFLFFAFSREQGKEGPELLYSSWLFSRLQHFDGVSLWPIFYDWRLGIYLCMVLMMLLSLFVLEYIPGVFKSYNPMLIRQKPTETITKSTHSACSSCSFICSFEMYMDFHFEFDLNCTFLEYPCYQKI